MRKMTVAEAREFVMTGTRTGKLATVRANGRPHVVPVWFVLDGDDLLFTTWHESVKARNMLRNGRVALCIDQETPPFDFVMVEGFVTISDDLAELNHWATRIAARYMGDDQAEAYGLRNSVPGEWLVRVHLDHWLAQADIAGW